MSKGLEALKHLYTRTPATTNAICVMDYEIIQKELKALEIIKIKKVNVWSLYTSFRTKELWAYNNGTIAREYKLTQEEYELLKEVLK